MEERAKSNSHRIDDHERRLDSLEKTYSIMEKMDYRMGKVETAVDNIDKKLDAKVSEDNQVKGKKWDKLVDYLFYAVLASMLGYISFKSSIVSPHLLRKRTISSSYPISIISTS